MKVGRSKRSLKKDGETVSKRLEENLENMLSWKKRKKKKKVIRELRSQKVKAAEKSNNMIKKIKKDSN